MRTKATIGYRIAILCEDLTGVDVIVEGAFET